MTVATANEPTILDPAILRRPGRFDRVVHFPNPSAVLRREYFCRIHEQFLSAHLDSVVTDSEGFSFAQLREAYIMAGQLAFERNGGQRVSRLREAIGERRRRTGRPHMRALLAAPGGRIVVIGRKGLDRAGVEAALR